jgi:hypothetical protein
MAVSWPADVASAIEELAMRMLGRFNARPRMVDAVRVLSRLEAVNGTEKRLSESVIQELLQRADAAAAASDLSLRECPICCDEAVPLASGIECAGEQRHFYCFPCVSRTAEGQSRSRLGGGLRCPSDKCSAPPYDELSLSRGLSRDALDKLRAVRESALEDGFAKRMAELETRHALELARAGQVQSLRLDVIEKILTPKCPRCMKAFFGFTGCFALRCAPDDGDGDARRQLERAGGRLGGFCGAAFCGWCFADCGQDAHDHVKAPCGRNLAADGGYFSTVDLWQQSLRRMQRERLEAYLGGLEAGVRGPLRAALKRELEDLGL